MNQGLSPRELAIQMTEEIFTRNPYMTSEQYSSLLAENLLSISKEKGIPLDNVAQHMKDKAIQEGDYVRADGVRMAKGKARKGSLGELLSDLVSE